MPESYLTFRSLHNITTTVSNDSWICNNYEHVYSSKEKQKHTNKKRMHTNKNITIGKNNQT